MVAIVMRRPQITITVVDRKGPGGCHRGHKVGDSFDFDTGRGCLCPMAMHVAFPYVDILRYGGSVPGGEDEDSCFFCCPDVEVINVFKIERRYPVEKEPGKGCAKYKYNKLDLGEIDGIPRVLDAGQCNDSYSLVVVALKLAEALGLEDINDLPIVYNIAWYEQKAVIVLLALLHLGVRNIHLGPTLPAFLSPGVAALLVEKFGIAGIGTVEGDKKQFDLQEKEAL